MKKLRHSLLSALLLLAPAAGAAEAAAGVDPAMREDILRLFDVTNTRQMATQMGTMMAKETIQMLARQSERPLPPAVQRTVFEVVSEVMEERSDELFEELIALYAEHFSSDEIRQLAAFYETPLGAKVIEVMPQLMQRSFEVGKQWGAAQEPLIRKRLQQRLEALDDAALAPAAD